jgi:hypothetical protein
VLNLIFLAVLFAAALANVAIYTRVAWRLLTGH